MIEISVIMPALNEEEIIQQCCENVIQELHSLNRPFEIILIDDGSTDNTKECIVMLSKKYPQVRGIILSRNFGHQSALLAGMHNSKGNAVIMMDCDLQHPPKLLKIMHQYWKNGYKIVYTVRQRTVGATCVKNISSWMYYFLFNLISETKIPKYAADFRLIDRQIVDVLNNMPESSIYFRGLLSWVGYKQIGVPYTAEKRGGGKTSYSLPKMWALAIDSLFRFSSFPLYLILYLGLLGMVASMLYGSFIIWHWWNGAVIQGWSSVLLINLIFSNLSMICIGIIGRYVDTLFVEAKKRPHYLISEYINQNE